MAQIRLTPEDAGRLHALQSDLQDLELDIHRAERAGLDVSAHKKKLSEVKALREGVLREFSPGARHLPTKGAGA